MINDNIIIVILMIKVIIKNNKLTWKIITLLLTYVW